jgi:hypothetical protein
MGTLYQDRHHRWVYLFTEGSSHAKKLLGGKGAGLVDMTHAGLLVPPGFVIPSRVEHSSVSLCLKCSTMSFCQRLLGLMNSGRHFNRVTRASPLPRKFRATVRAYKCPNGKATVSSAN